MMKMTNYKAYEAYTSYIPVFVLFCFYFSICFNVSTFSVYLVTKLKQLFYNHVFI